MSLTLLILGGVCVLGALVWFVGRWTRPTPLDSVSEGWIHEHRYERQKGPD